MSDQYVVVKCIIIIVVLRYSHVILLAHKYISS